MNSHQRRKERREWKYPVPVEYTDRKQYIDMFEWCQKNFGGNVNDGWRDPRPTYDPTWKFNCPKKAAVFAMRWK